MANQAAFAAAVLHGIGAPVTSQNIAGFIGWSKAEGGDNWVRNNPLNTTESSGGLGSINSAGVQRYGNPQAGIRATVQTLRNGRYGGIINAFRSGNVRGLGAAIGSSPWGTSGSLASQTIAETLGQHFNVPSGGGGGGGTGMPAISGGGATGTVSRTVNTFDQQGFQNAQARYQAGQAEQAASKLPGIPGATRGFASSLGNPNAALFSSGALTTSAPNAQHFMTAQTQLQKIAGNTRLNPHPLAQVGLANNAINDAKNAGAGRDATKLLGMVRSVIGAQYSQANHAAALEGRGQVRSQGTDCSGLISWLMGPNGLGIWNTSYATPGIPSAPGMRPGKGSVITVWNNRQAGNAGHVFIQIGNQYFASEGGVGVRQLPMSEVQNYLQHGSDGGTYQALHPRGL